MISSLRQRVFQVIGPNEERKKTGIIFDWFIIVLIIINVFLVIIETFDGIPEKVRQILYYAEVISLIIFTIEYMLRLWTSDYYRKDMNPAKARIRYIFSFMAMIDLLAILPFYLPFIFPVDLRVLRAFRLLRLLRLLKVSRYTSALVALGNVMKKKKEQLVTSLLVLLVLMVMASILMYSFEHEAQPNVFENAFSGLWWAIAVLTRTGQGNLQPITTMGRLLGAMVSVLGIGLLAVPTGIISAGFIEDKSNKKKESASTTQCPYCERNNM
jgi:voltage-gated potassium channel